MTPRKTSALIRDEQDNVLRFEVASDLLEDADGIDDVEFKVKEAQERLTALRQQQEELERQKKQLEELRVKKERFGHGKRDMIEKLTRTTSTLDRELYDAQKLVEEISITRDTFTRHLDVLRQIQPEKWPPTQVDDELENALAAIEDAEDDYTKGVRRISTCRRAEAVALAEEPLLPRASQEGPVQPFSASDDLKTWLRRGFAFTLPLMGALVICLILARLLF
jgi:chromosome segregation ATPase